MYLEIFLKEGKRHIEGEILRTLDLGTNTPTGEGKYAYYHRNASKRWLLPRGC